MNVDVQLNLRIVIKIKMGCGTTKNAAILLFSICFSVTLNGTRKEIRRFE